MLPEVVIHADWSSGTEKRWAALARLGAGTYRLSPPTPVLEPERLISSATSRGWDNRAVLGFDFPIGISYAFARRAQISDFLEALPEFGKGRWQHFYEPASHPNEISLERPFYPSRPGGTLQAHLVNGIGVQSMRDLLRRCDLGTEHRGRACSLFWTLGGNQVGRAAIAGWRQVLVPAMATLGSSLGIWPYHGSLADLIASRSHVVVETYPAEACVQLGLTPPGHGWSKRDRDGRASRGRQLLQWVRGKPIDVTVVREQVEEGFGASKTGEDRFDAFVGLLGMLAVVLGFHSDEPPRDDPGIAVEGWILGQRG